jgi:hypothetical protein
MVLSSLAYWYLKQRDEKDNDLITCAGHQLINSLCEGSQLLQDLTVCLGQSSTTFAYLTVMIILSTYLSKQIGYYFWFVSP